MHAADHVTSAPPDDELRRLLSGAHHDPHSALGAHPHPDGTAIRVLRPHADAVTVLADGTKYPLEHSPEGLFHGVLPGPPAITYQLRVRYGEHTEVTDDPYRWLPTLGEVDLHLIGEGRHERLWEALGAHLRIYSTPDGPMVEPRSRSGHHNARGCGDFDGYEHSNRPLWLPVPLLPSPGSPPTCNRSGLPERALLTH